MGAPRSPLASRSRNVGFAALASLLVLAGACRPEPGVSSPSYPTATGTSQGVAAIPDVATRTAPPVQVRYPLATNAPAYRGPDTYAYDLLYTLDRGTELVALGRYGRFVLTTGRPSLGASEVYVPDREVPDLASVELPAVPVWEVPPLAIQAIDSEQVLPPAGQTFFAFPGGLPVPGNGAVLVDLHWSPLSSGCRLVFQYQSPLNGPAEWQQQRVEIEISSQEGIQVRTADGSEAEREGEQEVAVETTVPAPTATHLLIVFTTEGGSLKALEVRGGDDPNTLLLLLQAADLDAPFVHEPLRIAYLGAGALPASAGDTTLESFQAWTIPAGDRDAASWLVDSLGEPVPMPSESIDARASDAALLARWGDGVISGIDFSQDDSFLAVATNTGSVRLFSTETWQELQRIDTALRLADSALALSPDGRSMAVASTDSRVGLWNVWSGDNVFLNDGPPPPEYGWDGNFRIGFIQDGEVLGVWYPNGQVRLLRSSDGASITEQQPIQSNFVDAWGAAPSSEFQAVAGHLPSAVQSLSLVRTVDWQQWLPTLVTNQIRFARAVSPDGSIVVAETGSSVAGTRLEIWRESSSGFGLAFVTTQPAELEGESIGRSSAEFLAAGSRLAVYSEYGPALFPASSPGGYGFSPRLGRIEVWDLASEASLGVQVFPVSDNPSVALNEGGDAIAYTSSHGTVDIVSFPEGQPLGAVSISPTCVGSLVLSPDGQVLASYVGNEIDLCAMSDGRLLHRILAPTDRVTSIAFSPDSQFLVSTGWTSTYTMGLDTPYDPNVHLWNVEDGSLVRTLRRQDGNIAAAAFSPDGEHLLTGAGSLNHYICVDRPRDTSIVVWRVSDWVALESRPGPLGGVSFLGFSGDGDYYAFGSNACSRSPSPNNRAWLSDAETGELLPAIASSGWPFYPAGMSSTGSYIALGDGDLWWFDVPGGEPTGHASGPISSFAFSPGDHLLAVSGETSVSILDIDGSRETSLTAPFSITSLVFSADGRILLGSGEVPGVIFVWGLNEEPPPQSYEAGMIELAVDQINRMPEGGDGPLTRPRGVAVAPDGTLYVADTGNHRIVHFSPDGALLGAWGTYSSASDPPEGTFNEPWGVAVAPDGTVYVADTWHHRVQHFTADGDFLDLIDAFSIGGSPQTFWGPRAVAVDLDGRVYVADTGYSRIVVFDSEGDFVEVIGEPGYSRGQFSEPLGLAVSREGDLYVADTWNRRVQVFRDTEAEEWPIEGWLGDSPDNKPFIAVSDEGQVCLSDPGLARILCFTEQGEFLLGWQTLPLSGTDLLPTGVAFDRSGHLWVTDGRGDSVRRFTPPFP